MEKAFPPKITYSFFFLDMLKIAAEYVALYLFFNMVSRRCEFFLFIFSTFFPFLPWNFFYIT